MVSLRVVLLAMLLWMPASGVANAKGDLIVFDCSWNDAALVAISVYPDRMVAKRDDGGKDYRVIKVSKWAVWLLVDEPEHVAGAAIHMIQRGAAITPDHALDQPRYHAGQWIDAIFSVTGKISPLAGGVCWERKSL